MPEVDKNLYFNNMTGEYEEGYRDPVTHVIHFGSGAPPEATDAALMKASELSVNLGDIEGTGKEGRVTAADVEKHAKTLESGENGSSDSAQASAGVEDQNGSAQPQSDAGTDAAAVEARAQELNVDLNDVAGSGPDGEITIQDVENQYSNQNQE